MKMTIFMLFALGLTLFIVGKGEAQTIFFADFEDNSQNAVPSQAVNDLANWVPENAAMIWAYDTFANGSQGLKQTVEGCGNSGNTPLMGVDNFTDGFMQMEMSWADNDEWGFIFRQSAPDKGYIVAFGASETPAVIVARLDDGCGANGVCLSDTAPVCENNPDVTLAQEPHGLTIDEVENGTAYLGRVEAIGNTIKVWYLPLADVADPNAQDLGPPLIEIQDDSHVAGSVGVYQGSQGNCMIDNVQVAGVLGSTAVNADGKLTTTWAIIKN